MASCGYRRETTNVVPKGGQEGSSRSSRSWTGEEIAGYGIAVISRRKRAHQIHVEVIKAALRNVKHGEGSANVAMNLGLLTWDAGTCPEPHLPPNPEPDEFGRD